MNWKLLIAVAACSLAAAAPCRAADARPDIVVADFEGKDYGDWKTTGEAFGPGPAQGTLPDQMPVSGYEGHGLVNSYYHGDKTTGTLTSPEFHVDRKFLNFLIGGGNHPGETCINLLEGGKVVRTETGPDSERLDWATWDLTDLAGKTVRIEIVDRHTGGWGHINVDQITQSDVAKSPPAEPAPLFHEWLRPQFHFTAKKNWLNDPNGLVFYQGEYHLFFQYNPASVNDGNKNWGHAISTDLLHWREVDVAIAPDQLGDIWSGSAVVDWQNTSGFAHGDEKPIVCIYTAAGGVSEKSKGHEFTQCISYSTDRGRTWQKFAGNPVLGHIVAGDRDPKLIWHAPTRKWVMTLYLDGDKYALFGSSNLKQWTKLSDLPPFKNAECPDIFELPVSGATGQSRWIVWGANCNYLVGQFDGEKFTAGSGPHRFEYGANYYAAQTYSDIPATDGRRIQIAWMAGGKYPHMPFNQQMSFPSELTLRQTPAGLRLFRQPVRELETLHAAAHHFAGPFKAGDSPLATANGDLFDLRAEVTLGSAKEIKLMIRGAELVYDPARSELRLLGKTAPLKPADGVIKLQVLVDRSSIEVFANDGEVTMASCFIPTRDDGKQPLAIEATGATAKSLDVWELKSCWTE
jgi:sucrose-6-phosphate hydrolase SacC (GH32 family)